MKKSSKVTIANVFLVFSQEYKEKGRNGAEMLRDCVKFLDNRREGLNDDKTPIELLNEFADILKD